MSSDPKKGGANFNVVWLAVGIGIGTAIGAGIRNVGVGIALGTAIGMSFACAIPAKKR